MAISGKGHVFECVQGTMYVDVGGRVLKEQEMMCASFVRGLVLHEAFRAVVDIYRKEAIIICTIPPH